MKIGATRWRGEGPVFGALCHLLRDATWIFSRTGPTKTKGEKARPDVKLLVSSNPPLLPKSTYACPSPSASGHCVLLFPYGHLRVTFTQVC